MLRHYHQQLVETLHKRMNLVLHQKTFPTFGLQSHNQESLFFNNNKKNQIFLKHKKILQKQEELLLKFKQLHI